MRLSKTLGFVAVLALLLMGAGAVADDDYGRGDFAFGRDQDHDRDDFDRSRTATPIKRVVVIFQENISFDHYFGTYPNAQNKPGETPFDISTTAASSQHSDNCRAIWLACYALL